MRLIEELCDYIHEEICDAEKYVKAALEYKADYPDTAETFYVLSMEELNHMQILHNAVTAVITKYRREHGEPPADMLAVYNYLHEKAIDDVKDVKILQAMYKE